jgi:hypothetical protein
MYLPISSPMCYECENPLIVFNPLVTGTVLLQDIRVSIVPELHKTCKLVRVLLYDVDGSTVWQSTTLECGWGSGVVNQCLQLGKLYLKTLHNHIHKWNLHLKLLTKLINSMEQSPS